MLKLILVSFFLECLIIKSGSDFRTFTSVEVYVTKNESVDAKMIRYDVPKQVAIDPGMNEVVQSYMKLLENSLDTCIGTIGVSSFFKFMSDYKIVVLNNFRIIRGFILGLQTLT